MTRRHPDAAAVAPRDGRPLFVLSDVAVAGHSHLPALVEVNAGRFYVNAGDWISHMSYATVAPERGAPPVLCRWATK